MTFHARMCQEFTSKMTAEKLIGRARERWEEIDNKGLDWKSFANGWLEGRIDLMSSKLTKKLDREKMLIEFLNGFEDNE